MEKSYDYMTAIVKFEDGELDYEETVELFQYLVDTGLAWILQGRYGRTASDMQRAGIIS